MFLSKKENKKDKSAESCQKAALCFCEFIKKKVINNARDAFVKC